MPAIQRTLAGVAVTATFALVLGGCAAPDNGNQPAGGTDAGGQSEGGKTLVAETTMTLLTIDPAYQFEFTGSMIDSQIYETTLVFEDGDIATPKPGLCDYEMNGDSTVLTLKCADLTAKFSNGDPVTVDDIVFSLQRTQGVGGEPSFYLDGVTVAKVDDSTITLTSEEPNPALPYILPNSNLGVVNEEVVRANGGTTDENDAAREFMNENSQGSGPYMVESYNPDSEVVLVHNPHYDGPVPDFTRIVIRNASAETQLSDVQVGQAQVVYDIGSDQLTQLDESLVHIEQIPTQSALYIFHNQGEDVNHWTSNPKFVQAVRAAVDYDRILAFAGEGSQRLVAQIPNEFLGAPDASLAPKRDLEQAKALLAEIGYNGEAVPFHYSSDTSLGGISIAQLAETVQAQLKEAGINVDLKPAPGATQLDGFRSGKQPMGIGTWGADFPDPSNYHVFLPKDTISNRINWTWDDAPKLQELFEEASSAVEIEDRDKAYKELYTELGLNGPFVNLVQPVGTVVISKQITEYESNAVWDLRFEVAK